MLVVLGVNIAFLIVFAHPKPPRNSPLFENRALAFIFQFGRAYNNEKKDGKDILARR